MVGSKNYFCAECGYEDNESGECFRCGGQMQDISGREYIQANAENELEENDMGLKDDFDFSDISEDGFEEIT